MVTSLSIITNTTTTRSEIIATIREPVIAEPLNYSSGTNYGNCMWSVSNLELNLQFGSLYRMLCLANPPETLEMNVTLSDAYLLLLLDVTTLPTPG